ncbi:PREDICTED: vascular endothelial growth factor C-like isoform X1 [Cyprinodon variegatus]|uniref:Vascular endothelial growth factor C-like n=1 Tax=Cyprinodon variegatus TaxID=28743 RepID=A0A3Q2E7N8_CYPVA|nr:PREDICTED: vascular endothelial growth factor C-like isoform X1 [Cyprinodon variegatus]
MWIPAVLLWMLNFSYLCSGQDYMNYYQSPDRGTEAPSQTDDQSNLEITNMDQLLQFFYPEYSVIQQCMRKRSWHASSSSFPSTSFSTSSVSPLARPGDDDLWVPLRAEPLYKDDGNIAEILEELKRIQCQPREVCVEVAKEYPESTGQLHVPRCVALHRCGGCCGNEAFYCTNTSYSLVNKTLMELSPPRMDQTVVMVTFVNHTTCTCLSKRPLHSIIRRAATDYLCSPPELPCASGSLWDPVNCGCISADTMSYTQKHTEALDSGLLALCGPNRVLEESTCDCVCQNGLTEASCDPGRKLDPNTCECQCEGQGDGKLCPARQRWDDELCGCVCAMDCPGNQPLNPDTCLCECRESPKTCLRQGKRFDPNTCSCYRLPCRNPRRECKVGFYYSSQVCQCIPNYMKWNYQTGK